MNRHSVLFAATLLCMTGAATGQEVLRPAPMSKELAMRIAQTTRTFDQFILKFREGSGVRLEHGRLTLPAQASSVERQQLAIVQRSLDLARFSLLPEFNRSAEALDARRAAQRRRGGRPLADLNLYARAKLQTPGSLRQLMDILQQLNQYQLVELAYVPVDDFAAYPEPPDGPWIAPPGITPLFVHLQGYLGAAPEGVNAFGAWTQPGGTGQGVSVLFYDNDYRASHEDVPNLFYSHGGNNAGETHGTAVLGILAAPDNSIGIKGVVHDADIGFHAVATFVESHADELLDAAEQLAAGDVLLTEVGPKVNALGFACPSNPTQANGVPIEFYPAEFDAVASIVSEGITVVETAGNGCVDFDSDVFQGQFADAANDSGAIWVGASLAAARTPTAYSNFGSRVHVHAWGEQIVTLSYLRDNEIAVFDKGPDRLYVPNFGGTSGAGAIVAGAAASVQAQVIAANGTPLSTSDLRSVLITTGTAQTGDLDRPIGPMPDIVAAANAVLE